MTLKVKFYWAGFVGGKLHWVDELHSMGVVPAIYRTKREAKRFYEDVRKVHMSIQPKVKP